MTTYNVLIQVPDDLDLTETHQVEYEEEVPIYNENDEQVGTEIVTRTRTEYLIGNDVVWEIANLYTRWPALVTPGTSTVVPTKLMHCHVDCEAEDIETYLESLIIAYDLDWTLLHIQTFHAEEEILGPNPEAPEEDIVIGHQAKVILSTDLVSIEDYLQPRYEDEAQTIEVPKEFSWLHVYQGQAPWRIN